MVIYAGFLLVEDYFQAVQKAGLDNDFRRAPARLILFFHLNYRLLLRQPFPQKGGLFYKLYSSVFDFHSHKWMYDVDSLTHYFLWAGFKDVCEMQFNQSRVPNIHVVEVEDRVLNGAGICVEGVKQKNINC